MSIKRMPSIHLDRASFKKIVSELVPWSNKEVEEFCDEVFIKARPKSLTSRSMYVSNQLMEKKMKKVESSNNDDTHTFIKILAMVRRKFHHRGIQDIKETSKEWLTCKDITSNALKFCDDFQLGREEGFKEYIELGLKLTQKYYLNKFLSLHETISSMYEANQVIKKDDKPEATRRLHTIFQALLIDQTGLSNDYTNKPDKYQYFILARKLADELGIDYRDYIKAQFAAFEWRGGLPEPVQLSGEKARERVVKYAFSNKIMLKNTSKRKIDFTKIKNHE